ncbi:uncharacterized protein BXZ73DRAFT_12430, partial [Epithele typhae]|uniref:uncharacterized protein n=1 Tax=Epithele typhae TaxID=378194 RepID=UPI00200881E3
LNFDVMHIIWSFSDRSTLFTFRKTCRDYRHEVIRYILKEDVILNLERPAKISSFLHFVQADPTYRVWSLRGLVIASFDSMDNDTAKASDGLHSTVALLTAVTNHPNRLLRLAIHNVEEILEMTPSIYPLVVQLSNLQELRLFSAGNASSRLVTSLPVHLRRTSLVTMWHYHVPGLSGPDTNPLLLLQNHTDTLEECVLGDVTIPPDAPVYHCLTTLRLQYIPDYHVERYVHAFPNLQFLHLDYDNMEDSATMDAEMGLAQMDHTRARNMSNQEHWGTWPRLRVYDGPIAVLYVLGLQCPIADLRLNDDDDSQVHFGMLPLVLQEAVPSHLALRI